jgi:3-oxoacyl-[acyl-carrier protein] reductase
MKKVVITGASQGIGQAIAETFLAQNYVVHNLSRHAPKYTHQNLQHWQADMLDYQQLENVIQQIGLFDVLINNAGYMNTLTASSYTCEERQKILNVNLIHSIQLSIDVAEKIFKPQQAGRIISIASIAGQIGHPDIWYGISKAGLINGMRSLARSHAQHNIQTFSIAPGPVETQMMQKIPVERQKRLKEATLNQQFCQAQEIADTAFWLADAAPNCLSGEVFDLNNGVNYR